MTTKPIVDILPSTLVENSFHIDMDFPFSFDGREYLKPVYDDDVRIMVLYFGRQSEKSTTLANKILLKSCTSPRFRTLYVTPETNQTKEFSVDKLLPKLEYSPILKRHLWGDQPDVDNVFTKQLKNGSRITMRSAFQNADRTRGISADLLCVDEIQHINPDFLPVMEECISHSPYRGRLYAGTPDVSQDALDQVWGFSDQTEFIFRCSKGHWNRQDHDMVAYLDAEGLHCRVCGVLLDKAQGEWVVGHRDGKYKGYRASQLMVPWLSGEDILDKQERYPPKRFLNEVLALPYEAMGSPVTEERIRVCCEESFHMIKEGVTPDGIGSPVYAGIDWGTGLKSYTILVFVTHVGGKWTVLRAKRFSGVEADANRSMDLIIKELHRFKPVGVSCDWGFGHLQNAQIKLKYHGGEVRTVFSSTGAAPIVLDNTGRYVINRTNMMSRVFNMILEERIRFPRFEDFGTFAKDILAIKAEDPDANGVRSTQLKYTHVAPDDYFHAMMYALIAGEVATGNLIIEAF
jgi:hypothetical protein